jgi:hypothetical protein
MLIFGNIFPSIFLLDQITKITRYCQLFCVKCVSLTKMLPLTAVLKCPHYEKGYYSNESEGEAEAPSPADGNRW